MTSYKNIADEHFKKEQIGELLTRLSSLAFELVGRIEKEFEDETGLVAKDFRHKLVDVPLAKDLISSWTDGYVCINILLSKKRLFVPALSLRLTLWEQPCKPSIHGASLTNHTNVLLEHLLEAEKQLLKRLNTEF